MTAMSLTPRQRDAYNMIAGFIAANDGLAPSIAEIAAGLGLKSKGQAVHLLDALVERGYIVRLRSRRRAIALRASSQPAEFDLAPALQARLAAYCQQHGDQPADVISDAVTLHLDELEARQ